MDGRPIAIQQSLFPQTMDLAAADVVVLKELLPDLHDLGYHLEPFGNNTFVIQGTPADVDQGNEKVAIEKMLEQYKHFSNDLKYSKREKLLRSLAWQQAIKAGKQLGQKEMQSLVQELFFVPCQISPPMASLPIPLSKKMNWTGCLGDDQYFSRMPSRNFSNARRTAVALCW